MGGRPPLCPERIVGDSPVAQRLADAAGSRPYRCPIDDFERDVAARDPEAVAGFCTLALDSSSYPEGFEHRSRIVYRPDPREVVVESELPPQSLIPAERGYKYVAARDETDTLKRPDKEIKDRYARLIAQVVPADVAASVTFYGHVSTTDPATGQPVRPCLLNVTAEREVFETFVLESLDPVACLRNLNALVSNHPYDLEPVRPATGPKSKRSTLLPSTDTRL